MMLAKTPLRNPASGNQTGFPLNAEALRSQSKAQRKPSALRQRFGLIWQEFDLVGAHGSGCDGDKVR